MPWLVGIVIVLVILYQVRDYLISGVALIAAVVFAYLYFKRMGEANRQAAHEAQAEANRIEAARRAYQARQIELTNQVRGACAAAQAAYGDIPRALQSAEALTDRAERDFADSAFSPFWESIESVVASLAAAEDDLRKVHVSLRSYRDAVPQLDQQPPPFPVDVEDAQRLLAVDRTGVRLKEVVRSAQRNFQFASIFEQRKTTHVLVAGFENLGDAIEGVGARISSSVSSLCDEVVSLQRVTATAAIAQIESQRNIAERQEEQAAEFAERQHERLGDMARDQERQTKILDDMHHGRKPPPSLF